MSMNDYFPVSLVIPVFNESENIADLLKTIKEQSYQPAEIILVDGGSTDDTVRIIKEYTVNDPQFRLIEAGRAMPGKGRNIGTKNAVHAWIAYTDAGIKLDKYWLENLVKKAKEKLSTTHLSISEIAYDLGFGHPQSFSKLFKNKTNKTPLEFRESFN